MFYNDEIGMINDEGMNAETFKIFWQTKYPEAYPVGHELKWTYPNRWFRIHSLPESKRYAESEKEYQILLKRQNELISDLVEKKATLILLFPLYGQDDWTIDNYGKIIDYKKFLRVDTINLGALRPDIYEEEASCDIFVRVVSWEPNKFDAILKLIADDEIKMMFICPEKNLIITPYDGGVDIIMETSQLRDEMKAKYHKWLSKHPEGL